MEHERLLHPGLDFTGNLLIFGIHHIGRNVNILKRTVCRNIGLAYQLVVKFGRILLSGKRVCIMQDSLVHGTGIDGIDHHLLAHMTVLNGKHGFAQCHRHLRGRRAGPCIYILIFILTVYIPVVVAVIASGLNPESKRLATQFVRNGPYNSG